MTKQEQIEEIAKYVCNVCDFPCDDHKSCPLAEETAEAIYNAGYRIIKEKNETRQERNGLKAEIKHLNTIVERLDELLAKGIDEYIMGIDGVEGLKDMWERAAVMEFAKKVKEKYSVYDDRHILYRIIDELLKEYE